jgi:hypothetical protein
MNLIEQEITFVREQVKDAIVRLVKEIYLAIYKVPPQMVKDENGEDDYFEDWRINVSRIPKYVTILVDATNERLPIWEYIVTLDDDLYFYPAEIGEEFHWEEITTDDLVSLFTHLLNHKDILAQ